jgi:hypothetical protein
MVNYVVPLVGFVEITVIVTAPSPIHAHAIRSIRALHGFNV